VTSDAFVSEQWENTQQLQYSEHMSNVFCASNTGTSYKTITRAKTLGRGQIVTVNLESQDGHDRPQLPHIMKFQVTYSRVRCDAAYSAFGRTFLGAFTKLRKATINFIMSGRPHETTRLPLNVF
jgi:hypothetical protein